MKTDCVNLRKTYGRRFKVAYEETYYAEYGRGARIEDAWYMVMMCRYGHVFPHGGTTLAASVDGHPKVAGRLKKLSCCRVQQDGDFGELTAVFDVADFERVAQVMRPRRRRRVSEKERARLREIGFKRRAQPHIEEQYTDRRRVRMGRPDNLVAHAVESAGKR